MIEEDQMICSVSSSLGDQIHEIDKDDHLAVY